MKGKIKISCSNIWKLYGENPEKFLKETKNNPTTEQLKLNKYIPAVRDASIDVKTGEILVIMGLSGSGKSTLLRCMSKLIQPTDGKVFFEGKDLLKASDKELIEIRRHKMGMVFQHFALLPHRTVLQNVAFPLEVQGIDLVKREDRAKEVIKLVGLEGREKYYPRELSGGQQQRVGLARSLAVEPDVWFLDEPFSALDPLIRKEMQNEFLRLQNMLKKTIVFITHDLDESLRLGDHIGILNAGKLVQVGTPVEIIMNPADEYVEAFVKDVNRTKVIKAKIIMKPINQSDDIDKSNLIKVGEDQFIEEFLPQVVCSNSNCEVVDKQGNAKGYISNKELQESLRSS